MEKNGKHFEQDCLESMQGMSHASVHALHPRARDGLPPLQVLNTKKTHLGLFSFRLLVFLCGLGFFFVVLCFLPTGYQGETER